MPTDWIERSPGVRYCSTVSLSIVPSSSLRYSCCTEPLPKLRVPMTIARSRFLSAPATISDAEAEPLLTSTTIGKLVSPSLRSARRGLRWPPLTVVTSVP